MACVSYTCLAYCLARVATCHAGDGLEVALDPRVHRAQDAATLRERRCCPRSLRGYSSPDLFVD